MAAIDHFLLASDCDERRVSSLAVASWAFSVLAFLVWLIVGLLAPLLAALGVLFGLVGLVAIRRSNGGLVGRKRAAWGVAIGALNLVLTMSLMWMDSRPSYTFAKQRFG